MNIDRYSLTDRDDNEHSISYLPKSMNCFIEIGEGENFEKCSTCFGTFANAAFFMTNLTNFIVKSVTSTTFQSTQSAAHVFVS